PWCMVFRAASRRERLVESARSMRPLFTQAVTEQENLLAEAGASRYLRKNGWLKLYRTERAFAALGGAQFALAQELGVPLHTLDSEEAREVEPSLGPDFYRAVWCESAASVTNPLAVTCAYATRFTTLGGLFVSADARSLHRANAQWRVDTAQGPLDAQKRQQRAIKFTLTLIARKVVNPILAKLLTW